MGHKHNLQHKRSRKKSLRHPMPGGGGDRGKQPDRLEIIVKCGAAGSLPPVLEAINKIHTGLEIAVIFTGVGSINKNDLIMAATGSNLIFGYEVELSPGLEKTVRSSGVEVRIYTIIYRLVDDLRIIAESMIDESPEEMVPGRGRVIALFKSCRHGIILGCEVEEGRLAIGDDFRVISAMGEAYRGKIESLHCGTDGVSVARKGQQVGLKIRNFSKAAIGDLVETFRLRKDLSDSWRAKPGVIYCDQ